MAVIDVDFEVFKELTIRRRSEEMTENDVIRELLGLSPKSQKILESNAKQTGLSWIAKGVIFPSGTKFRATHKGKQTSAIVQNGSLLMNGKRYSSPSAAAVEVTGTSVNGWRFWECLFPDTTEWRSINDFRRN